MTNKYTASAHDSESSGGTAVGWFLRGLFLLAFAGAAGYGFYHFYWSIRIPQEHTVTNGMGEAKQVRIDGRSEKMLKVTLLDDGGQTAYYSISDLNPDDQRFAGRLPVTLNFEFPFDYTSTTGAKTSPLHILDRTDKMIKLSTGADGATRWALLKTFSPADQQFFANLPMGSGFDYPFTQTFTDPRGQTFAAEILGRDDALVQYTTKADGLTRLAPLTFFSAADQELLKAMPTQASFRVPMKAVITDRSGKSLPVTLEGRTADLVSYARSDNLKVYMIPLQRLSAEEQEVIGHFPLSDRVVYPFLTEMADPQGQPAELMVLGRTTGNLTVAHPGDSQPTIYDIAKLSKEDQAFARLLPITDEVSAPTVAAATPEGNLDIKPLRDELAVLQQQMDALLEQKTKLASQPVAAALNDQKIMAKQLEMNQTMASIIHLLAKASNTPTASRVDKTVADLRDKIVALDNQLEDATAHAKATPGSKTLPVAIQQAQTELATAQIQLNQQFKDIISRVK